VRLALTALGVALGVSLLLFTTVAFPALHAHDARAGWTTTSAHNRRPVQDESTTDPLLWRVSSDRFEGHDIVRVDVAAAGPRAPVPNWLAQLPGPGEIAASPHLAQLLNTTDPALLGDRFPGRVTETIGRQALRSSDELRDRHRPHARGTPDRARGADGPQHRGRSPRPQLLRLPPHRARRRSAGLARSRAGLRVHRDPPRRGAPRTTSRRDAPRGRDAPPGRHARRCGGRARRGRRYRARLPRVFPRAPVRGARPVRRPCVLRLGPASRGRLGTPHRDRRPRARGRGRARVAPPRTRLPARRDPADDAQAAGAQVGWECSPPRCCSS